MAPGSSKTTLIDDLGKVQHVIHVLHEGPLLFYQ
jgi:hypothetical protein